MTAVRARSDPLWFGDAYQPLRSGIEAGPPDSPSFGELYDQGDQDSLCRPDARMRPAYRTDNIPLYAN